MTVERALVKQQGGSLRENAGFVVAEDFHVYGAGSLFRPAFHEALKVNRAVFTGAVAFAGSLAFGPAELRVLPDLPVGARTQQVGIPARQAESRSPVPLLPDSGKPGLPLTEASLRVSQVMETRERNGHDDRVRRFGELRPARGETERVTSVVIFRDGSQRRVELNRSGSQGCGNRFRQTLIPTSQVIALVGTPKFAKVARVGLESQQVDKVQRALDGSFRAVFNVVRYVEKLTHSGPVTAGDARLDPVV